MAALTDYSIIDLVPEFDKGAGSYTVKSLVPGIRAGLAVKPNDAPCGLTLYNATDEDNSGLVSVGIIPEVPDTLIIGSRALGTGVPITKIKSYLTIQGPDPIDASDLATKNYVDIETKSVGVGVYPTITYNNPNITISDGVYYVNATVDYTGELYKITPAETTIAITTEGVSYYVYAEYGGTIAATTDFHEVHQSNRAVICRVIRTGSVFHTTSYDHLANGLPEKLNAMTEHVLGYNVAEGLTVSSPGVRKVKCEAGNVWYGATEIALEEVDTSGADQYVFVHHVAGQWTITMASDLNNTQYDNGTDLASLTGSNYAVSWIWRGVENQKHLYVLLGNTNDKLDVTKASGPPTPPEWVSDHAVLLARVIFQRNSNTAIVESVQDLGYKYIGVVNHNDTGNRQGGTLGEYYHLTADQHSALANSSLNTGVSGWKFTGADRSISVSSPYGLCFSADGTKFYVGGAGSTIYYFTMSTPWDITTASSTATGSTTIAEETATGQIFIKPDGTKMYIAGVTTGDWILQYTLNTPWDITSKSFDKSFTYGQGETAPYGFCFSSDGLKLYALGNVIDTIQQFNLSIAWDVGSAIYQAGLLISTYTGASYGLAMNNAGTKIYVLDASWRSIMEFTLVTPYDITTGTYTDRLPLSINYSTIPEIGNPETGGVAGLFYQESLNRCFVVGSSLDSVFEIDTAPSAPVVISPDTLKLKSQVKMEGSLGIHGPVLVSGAFITNTTCQLLGGATISGTTTIQSTSSNASHTVNISTNSSASGVTKTISIGTGGASGSTTNITLGSATTGAINNIKFNDSLIVPKASGYGIKVDTTTPTFGWMDLLGYITVKSTSGGQGGVNAIPDYVQYRGSMYEYRFGTLAPNNHLHEASFTYHIPHDYVMGSDLYVHIHWSQNIVDTGGSAGVPGVAKWYFDITYAKGHGTPGGAAAAFIAPITVSVTQQASTTQYGHMIAEVVFTNADGSAGLIDRDLIEPDGIVGVRVYRDPDDAADTLNQDTFVHMVDIHYQSTGIPTKNKAPNFWS